MSKKIALSPLRKFMLWVFGSPSNDPYINVNIDFEFDKTLIYLKELNKQSTCKISIHHFLLKVLADCFAKHPRMNVKIFGNEIYQLPAVNIATPINLVTDKWSPKSSELGMTIIKKADQQNLEKIAKQVSKTVQSYRKGGNFIFLEEIAKFLYKYLPNFSLRVFFKGVSVFGRNRLLYNLVEDLMGVSTFFTNVGSVIDPQPGIHYKSVSFTLPDKLVHFSVCFAAGPVTKKPYVENDQVVIKSVLPMVIIFDHRVVDGFLMNRFMEHLGDRLRNPEKYYPLPEMKQVQSKENPQE